MEADAAKQGPTFRFGDFRILQEIHRSASGAVYKAQHRTSNKSFVLKEKKAPEMGPGKALDSEAVLLSNLSHPNIIRCYGTFRDSARRSLFMVLEDATSGDLQTLLRRRAQQRQPLSEDEVLALFVQVCRGVAHLHAHNIVHRDLKALNIVLDAAGVPKVCDLGVSRLRSDETVFLNSFHGTPLYLSPELVDNEPYTEKTDVWSLGVLLYQLASLRLPFEGNSLGQIIGLIKSGKYAPLPPSISRHVSKLLDSMLHRKPHHRPSLPEILTYLDQLIAHRRAKAEDAPRGGSRGGAPARAADDESVGALPLERLGEGGGGGDASAEAHAKQRAATPPAAPQPAEGAAQARAARASAAGPPPACLAPPAAAAQPAAAAERRPPPPTACSERSDRSAGSIDRDELLRRRAAEFAAARAPLAEPAHGAQQQERPPRAPLAEPAHGAQQQERPPRAVASPSAAAAGDSAAVLVGPLRVLPLAHGHGVGSGAEAQAARRELGARPPSSQASRPSGPGSERPGLGAATGILPQGASDAHAGARGGESGRQQLLARRDEERRARLLAAASDLRPPPTAASDGRRPSSSASSAVSVGSSEQSGGGEHEMYALAARMHRMQLEAALWREPWRPTGFESGQVPPPLPTPSGPGARSDGSSVLSRRTYNIFTHEWEEKPL